VKIPVGRPWSRIILERILKKEQHARLWTGFIWRRIRFDGGLLWTRTVNCCWPSPVLSFLVPSPAGPIWPYFTVSQLWEWCNSHMMFVEVIFRHAIPTSQKRPHVSITKISWTVMLSKIILVLPAVIRNILSRVWVTLHGVLDWILYLLITNRNYT
jgi:hypothetical protein